MTEQSALPAVDEVRRSTEIEMKLVRLSKESSTDVALAFYDAAGEPLTAQMWDLSGKEWGNYMPSKVVLAEGCNELSLIYYLNSTLPAAARPFVGGSVLVAFDWPEGGSVFYDAALRLFIDQMFEGNRTVGVAMFSATEKEKFLL